MLKRIESKHCRHLRAKKERPEIQSRRPVSFECPDLSQIILMEYGWHLQEENKKNPKFFSR
jgi:hypothetical protein